METTSGKIEEASGETQGTGLPLLRSWRAVYIFVGVIFVVYVVLLTWLSRAFL